MDEQTKVASEVVGEIAEMQQAVSEVVFENPPFKVVIGNLIRVCPNGRTAWYESNVGKIRKPIYEADKIIAAQ